MEPLRVLALDISTKSGWSLGESGAAYSRLQSGAIPKLACPAGKYPQNFLDWARRCFAPVQGLIEAHKPDIIVIEETTGGSKNAHSQKILEFIHYLLASYLEDHALDSCYLLTEQWRSLAACKMTDAEKIQNKKVGNHKTLQRLAQRNAAMAGETFKATRARGDTGKVMGKISKKHVCIRRVNELFGLDLKVKNEDEADAIALGYAWHQKRLREEPAKAVA